MTRHDLRDFVAPRLSAAKLDVYGVRRAILAGLRRALPDFSGVLLDVGCGAMPYRALVLSEAPQVTRYIGMDLASSEYPPPELVWDGATIPLADASVGCAMATEVLEHVDDPSAILAEVARVLVPGGTFFFSVPFIWPLHSVPHDQYRFTPYALERHLRAAGFDDARISAAGSWDASLAQMIGLWVLRRPMNPVLRRVVALGARPLVAALLALDVAPESPFGTNQMPPSLTGTAKKRAR